MGDTPNAGTLAIAAVVAVSSFVLLVFTLVGGRKSRIDQRLETLSAGESSGPAVDPLAEFARTALPKMGSILIPEKEEERTKLRARLVHAGFYGRQAMAVFLGIKLVLIVGPPLVGAVAGIAGVVDLQTGVVLGCLCGASGLVGPSFWLDSRKAGRQKIFRRALPDALDVMVICVEGGLSLSAAIQRVASELRTAHPLLAEEMNLVQREMQLGRSPGEAIREFASRTDLEEVRQLAAVIVQAERFGASITKSLRMHADTLRNRRVMYAEEMAQKATVKLLFPTVLFILPALFIAVLGPISITLIAILDVPVADVPK